MWRNKRLIVALVLVFSVLAVCVSPFVDLDPTALRAAQAALMLALSIAGNAFLLFCLIQQQARRPYVSSVSDLSAGSVLDLVCSRIC